MFLSVFYEAWELRQFKGSSCLALFKSKPPEFKECHITLVAGDKITFAFELNLIESTKKVSSLESFGNEQTWSISQFISAFKPFPVILFVFVSFLSVILLQKK